MKIATELLTKKYLNFLFKAVGKTNSINHDHLIISDGYFACTDGKRVHAIQYEKKKDNFIQSFETDMELSDFIKDLDDPVHYSLEFSLYDISMFPKFPKDSSVTLKIDDTILIFEDNNGNKYKLGYIVDYCGIDKYSFAEIVINPDYVLDFIKEIKKNHKGIQYFRLKTEGNGMPFYMQTLHFRLVAMAKSK